jgi:predicted  nucleic acid-binding Zn-ribbon protein
MVAAEMSDAQNRIVLLEEELTKLQAKLEAARRRIAELEQQIQRHQLQLRQQRRETPIAALIAPSSLKTDSAICTPLPCCTDMTPYTTRC